MTLAEVKAAVDAGRRVYWAHDGYEVAKDRLGQYLITCLANDNVVGLTAAYVDRCFVDEDDEETDEYEPPTMDEFFGSKA